MKFLADECFDARLAQFIQMSGHDVLFQSDIAAGVDDEDVLAQANADKRILLTEDKDFGDLVVRQRRAAHGVVLIRLDGLSLADKENRLRMLLENCSDRIPRHFTVLESKRIRFRPIPL